MENKDGLPEQPNPAREEILKRLKEEDARHFIYAVCPIEGELLRIARTDDLGMPNLFRCPKCGKETTEPLRRQFNPMPYSYESCCNQDTGKFEPQRCANDIKANYLFKTDRESGILYRYNVERGKWSKDGEAYLKELLADILKNDNRLAHFNNVLHCLTSVTMENVEFSNLIACENGLLDVERGILSNFTPNAMPFHSIPVKFDSEAKCPNLEEFLKQVLAPEDIPTLQEWSGFLLLPDYRKHKLMWLHGEGFNGKGVWTRTMEGILGLENCSGVGLEEFDGTHRFALYQLWGSLFNTCSEPSTNKILQTPLLKKVTGQDTIDAERKGKQKRLKFRNVAKMTVIGNKFPKVADNTLAFQDRMMFIKFPGAFLGKEQIDDLERVWLEDPQEKSGILNWMLQGLHRLLSQGEFTQSKNQQKTMLEFQRVSDSIGAFLQEQSMFGPNLMTPRNEAFEAYKDYCDFIGAPPETDKAFTQRMKNTPRIKDSSTRIDGKKTRVWIGFSVKPLNEETGTDGTLGTSVLPQGNVRNQKYRGVENSVPTVPSVPNSEQRTCGQCDLWHKGGCCFPGDPSCVAPSNPYAQDCRSFTVNGEKRP